MGFASLELTELFGQFIENGNKQLINLIYVNM